MTTAAGLQPGTRIAAAGIGILTVTTVYADPDPDALVEVDVEPDRGCDIWEMPALATAAGAQSAQWLSNTPRWRYRLYFAPAAPVPVASADPTETSDGRERP
jgi:uncharacterized protein YcbX